MTESPAMVVDHHQSVGRGLNAKLARVLIYVIIVSIQGEAIGTLLFESRNQVLLVCIVIIQEVAE